ncbi:S1C family serine protease [Micromonospora sp. NBC_01813]|uniref:S1C family serine protease n=1 Tax=Micromonospora sp. NBC_01813 TaxID=2975988 RepID=UPI002DD92920|nr:trypsin-like peptidase domain-containing protein [Micromonospora sp. NBC_01813]WSA12206.1 trypsin-like peptidase domain-containing protein [Micromonospora sp. NBC_01813]
MSEHETTPPAEPSDKAQPSASPWQAPAAPGNSGAAAERPSSDWTLTNQPYAGQQPGQSPTGPVTPTTATGPVTPTTATGPVTPTTATGPVTPTTATGPVTPTGSAASPPDEPAAAPLSGEVIAASPVAASPVTAPPAAAGSTPTVGAPAVAAPQAGPYAPGYAQVPYGQQWSYGQQPYSGHGYPQAATNWSPPPGAAAEAAAQRRPSRVGRIVAGSAVVLALMLGSGAVGGAVVAAFDGTASPTVQTSSSGGAAAPIVDRSSLAEIADAVQDSVVSISTGSGEGSGVVLNAEGFILTNNHVVESAQGGAVEVVFADGSSAQGSVVGTDARTDLAVVKVDGVADLSPATFGDSSAMRVGDTVLALGSPLGLQGSVTAGIISAQDRTIQVGGSQQQNPFGGGQAGVSSMSGLLQTDAPINPGNSGGALVNTNGEVIGINTAIATSGQGEGNIGVGFAIPSDKAKDVAEALMAGEEVSHPYLGVNVTAADDGGAMIAAVQEDSPAARAGLEQGDVVTQIGGTPVNDSDDLVAAVQAGKVGDQLEITYRRDGEEATATATLAEAP